MNYFVIIYIIVTFGVILLVERLTYRFVGWVFASHIKEIVEKEKEIANYQELMILALAAKEKEAYKGLNQMADELYWKIFFRKLIIFSTSFFLLFSPYIILSGYFLKNKIKGAVGIDFVIAILFFMTKTIYYYIVSVLEARREFKRQKS